MCPLHPERETGVLLCWQIWYHYIQHATAFGDGGGLKTFSSAHNWCYRRREGNMEKIKTVIQAEDCKA